MYDQILQGIKTKHDLNSQDAVEKHLQNLQSSVRNLRAAFRNFPVKFDYTNFEIQQAYMFAYYPHYTELLEYALSSAKDLLGEVLPKKLFLFGSGPCPEIIGYLKFLSNHSQAQNLELSVSIFDIAATHWEYSRTLTYDQIIPIYRNGHKIVSWNSKDFHINKPISKISLSDEPHLVVYQNCLNEIELKDYQVVISNLVNIFKHLPDNSILAIIDFHEYSDVVELIKSIQTNLSKENGFKLLRDVNSGVIEKRSSYRIPTLEIRTYLLTGIPFEVANGLIPRSKVNFTYSLIQKSSASR